MIPASIFRGFPTKTGAVLTRVVCGIIALLEIGTAILCPLSVAYSQVYGEDHDEELVPNAPFLPDGTAVGTDFPLLEQDGAPVPNFRLLNFAQFPSVVTGGSIDFSSLAEDLPYDPSRVWQPGDPIGAILKVGDLSQTTAVSSWSLGFISEQAGIDLATVPLGSFGIIRDQTLNDLLEAIPELSEVPLANVVPLSIILEGQDPSSTLAEILAQSPDLGSLTLDFETLTEYSVLDLPGLSDAPLGAFSQFGNAFIQEVPGLSFVPLDVVFGGGFGTQGVVAIADLPWSDAEKQRFNTITGSYQEGFSVPCEGECAYAELSVPAAFRDDPVHPTVWPHGKQWIAGTSQEVQGGSGCLAGTEPTGRHPFGSVFKVVLEETSEPDGEFYFAIYFNFSIFCGTSPYIIGPFPFLTLKEGQFMFVGLQDTPPPDGGSPGGGVPPVALPPGTFPIPPGTDPNGDGLPDQIPSGGEGEVTGVLGHPLPGSVLTSPYGPRGGRFHSGTDFAYPRNDPRWPGTTIASDGGTVLEVFWDPGGCGNTVLIAHGPGLKTGYCHLSAVYVKKNQSIAKGSPVGKVGATGSARGANPEHLHFIVWKNGTKINPASVIRF